MDKAFIENHLDFILKETDFPELGERKVGKVRDIYFQDDKVILISTDRHTSFDRIIAHIPFKGQVLTQTSRFWFDQTKDIVANHVLSYPDPNVAVAKQYSVVPVEVVVRGFITGVTGTSLWTLYQQGQRDFGSFTLSENMKKNQRLEQPVITPSTKFERNDRTITPQQVVTEGLAEQEVWTRIEDIAFKLFARGQEIALQRGLILVDTKYEFGIDSAGQVTLIDEIHTPDSSRYWQADSYEEKLERGEEPEYFDKEFLRLWFKENCDPYKDKVLPEAPQDMVIELASRYIQIYEQITGPEFEVDTSLSIEDRIRKNLSS